MTFSSTKKKKTLSLKAFLLLALVLLQPFFVTAGPANAVGVDSQISEGLTKTRKASDLFNATYLYLITVCLETGGKRSEISSADVNNLNIFNDTVVSSGHQISPSDGLINCQTLMNNAGGNALVNLSGATKAQIGDYLYDDDNGDGKFDYISPNILEYSNIANSIYLKGIRDDLRPITLAAAFSKCYKETTSGGVKDVTVDDVDFNLNTNMKGNTEVRVTLGTTADGDTEYQCSTVANLMNQSNIYQQMVNLGLTTNSIRQSSTAFAAAIAANTGASEATSNAASAVNQLFLDNPEVLTFCVAYAGIPANIETWLITEWLVAPEDAGWTMYWETGTNTDGTKKYQEATDEQEQKLRGCLTSSEEIGTELTGILTELGKDLAAIQAEQAAITNAGGSQQTPTQEDQCLSADGFIGWVACPIITFIYEAADLFQTTVQELLEFSLSNETSNNQTIRPVWNVFRSLATTILIVGFLLTLLIKTIRGE